MILHTIGVQGWRCFADPMTVGPFGERINVIHAPNAMGKSTLLEALFRGFFDGHRVGGREAEMIRPWGRDLSPEVTLEFSDAGADYRLRKRFLVNASSELLRREGTKFVRLAEGEKADEFVRNLFAAGSPGRGLSKPAHWGLAQVLLVPQGELAVPELSGNLVTDIQQSLGAQVCGPGTGPLEQRIEALYLSFFTPTGKIKAGKEAPAIVEMRSRLEEIEGKRRSLLDLLDGFERLSRRVEDLRAGRAQAKRDAEGLEEELRKARHLAQSYRSQAAERDRRQEQVKSASARYSELKQRIDGIDAARKELAAAREDLERLKVDISERAEDLKKLGAQAEKAKADLEEVRKGRIAVDRAEAEAEYARRFVEAGQGLCRLEGLLGKVRGAADELEAAKKELARAVAPDPKTLKAIRKALSARDEAQVRLDAALITLEIVPQVTGRIEILAAEETGNKGLTPGAPVLVKGAPEVVVDLEGVARIRARGPAGTVEELREEVARETERVRKLTEGFGTADIDRLEALSEQARAVQQKVSAARTRLETLLSGSSREAFEQERRKQEKIIEGLCREHPGWADAPPDADSLRESAKKIKEAFISRVEEAELKKEKAEQAFQAANVGIAKLQVEHDMAHRRATSASDRLAEMQKDGMDDRERAEALKRLSLEWEAARSALEGLETELARFLDDPALVVDRLERQRSALQEQASNALEILKTEEGRLVQIAAEGPYSALSRSEEQIADLKTRIDAEELRIDAIRLLRDTIHQCRARILADLRRPVEESATRMLQRIAGARLGTVQLADRFQPQAVRPRIADVEVGLSELSGGEKEQVHLAVRLALAEVLAAGDERRFVVLDDALTATDTGRLARILSILEEAAQRLQLFILTCHPERYRGLADAEFFDVEGIVRG
jgi:DNA repair exonuclease SbcCD ATPase subunit